MKSKIKKIFTNGRILLLIAVLFLSLIAIHPRIPALAHGVAIKSVIGDSAADLAGIKNPESRASPTSLEIIEKINNIPVNNLDDYYTVVSRFNVNQSFILTTNKGNYRITVMGEDEKPLGLNVKEVATSNIRKGLDLEGGTRVLLKPEEKVSVDDLDIVVENIKRRLNVYGLADVNVKTLKDLEGNSFVLVEISGAQDEELKELLAKQGKFEAKIGNETVFKGGNDITYVCRSADCSGITSQGCVETTNGYVCEFRFSISLTPEAAQRQAEATKDLEIFDGYLSQNLSLFLDDELVDELRISSGLKGKAETEISISGSGVGGTYEEAALNTLDNMKRLQTILITGSLPVKLEIINTETLSPLLGEDFLKNVLFIGVLALVSVIIVITLRYRKLIIALPIALTMVSEVIIILGVASMISWNLDLVAIAGIIIAVGTGVDDLIIITDETLNEKTEIYNNWKEKLKKAFFIIMAAYFTTLVAMLPLWFAGAGLLKGFALTTIIGISAGVLISRPAFGRMIEILVEE
ncbi:hypothetical protein JW949_03225 [Candidatus Woesearchaeota archaeon]|nr:hypothetical protein [Candidatus Woesearchaeota archaeon]